jgi:hypothetical protein
MYFDEALKRLRDNPELFYIRRPDWDDTVCLGYNFDIRNLCFRELGDWDCLKEVEFLSLDQINSKDWEVIYSEDTETTSRIRYGWKESSTREQMVW